MKNYFFTAFVLLFANALIAQNQIEFNSDKALKIAKANEKVTSFSATFKQTKMMSFMNDPVVTEGDCFYKRGDKLCMKYTKPVGELMLINGTNVTIARGGKVRTLNTKNGKAGALANMLLSCIKGEFSKLEAKNLTYAETASGVTYSLNVNMVVGKSKINRLVLTYDKSNLTLNMLKMEEPDGSYTSYEIVGKNVNSSFDNSVFAYSKK